MHPEFTFENRRSWKNGCSTWMFPLTSPPEHPRSSRSVRETRALSRARSGRKAPFTPLRFCKSLRNLFERNLIHRRQRLRPLQDFLLRHRDFFLLGDALDQKRQLHALLRAARRGGVNLVLLLLDHARAARRAGNFPARCHRPRCASRARPPFPAVQILRGRAARG